MRGWRWQWGKSLVLSWSAVLLGSAAIAMPLEPRTDSGLEPNGPTLEGTTWELISFRQPESEQLAAIEADQKASLRLQASQTDARLQGNTGCNTFFGRYRLNSSTAQLQLTPVGSTLRACLSEALSQQEQALLAGLPQVATYSLEGDRLQLRNADQQVLFTLRAQPMLALTETEWYLQSYNNGQDALVSPIANTELTAQFELGNRRLSGSTGCNRYFAAYQAQEQQLTIGSIGSTRRACLGETAQQEQTFLQLLAATCSYQIEGDRLQLFDAQQQLLAVFTTKASS